MSINKVIILGRVGKDPEVKYFDNGNAVASFSVATTERGYTTTKGVNVPERTEWHNIVCWKGLAKIAEQYVKKGDLIYIEGKIQSRSYDDANGIKRYVTEIYAETIELLGKSSNNTEGTPSISPTPQNDLFPDNNNSSVNGTGLPGDDGDDFPF